MFTGLVDDIGTIDRVASTDAGIELRITCRHEDLAVGESIAVNGVCLTVRDAGCGMRDEGRAPRGWFTCAAMITTAGLTTIGDWGPARKVNLERALRPTDRLGGHFVQGHVDGVARVTRADTVQDALLLELALPPGLAELMVERGSVALDGVSLTVSGLPRADIIQVSIIEHTRRHTTLGDLRVGGSVHVEADILAKHVRKLLSANVRRSSSDR